MPHPYQTNFTAGELSPRLYARQDFNKYGNGAELLKNFHPLPQGGASRRAGSFFVHEVNDSTKKHALIPFVFSASQAYVVELGPATIRIYRDRKIIKGQGDGTELVTNGTFNTNLTGWTITNTGTGTTVWNAGGFARLNGGAAGTTRMSQSITTTAGEEYIVEFKVASNAVSVQVGTADGLGDVLASSSFDVGTYKLKVTSPGAVWLQFSTGANLDSDIDNVKVQKAVPLLLSSPYAEGDLFAIDYDQSADVLYLTHPSYQPQKLLRISDIEWELRPVSPQPPPSSEQKVFPAGSLTPGATSGLGVTFTASSAVFLASDVNRIITAGAGRAVVKTFTDTTHVVADITDNFSSTDPIRTTKWAIFGSPSADLTPSAKEPVHKIITLTASIAAFRATDVGRYIRVFGGLVKVTKFTTATSVDGEILLVLRTAADPIVASKAGNWTLEDADWSSTNGYPGAIAFHEQRLVLAGSNAFPLRLWGSVNADFENFARGTLADDAFSFTLASGRVNLIRWLASVESLVAGTLGAEFRVRGSGLDEPITPANVPSIKPQTAWGSDYNLRALRVGAEIIHGQRGGRALRELAFKIESGEDGSYQSTELTILADHLFSHAVTQIARITSPQSVILAVRCDGVLLSCAYERPENVVAWARAVTGPGQDLSDGFYESVCVIPNKCGTSDEVWTVVKRVSDDTLTTLRYVEVFDGALNTDSALVYEGGDTVDSVKVPHLAKQSVRVIADGVVSTKTASATGVVTLDAPAANVEVGLYYVSRLRTLRPEFATPSGTRQSRRMKWDEVFVRVYCTSGSVVVKSDSGGSTETVTVPSSSFTGDLRKPSQLGWNRDGRLTIEKTDSRPCTILGITGKVSIEDEG